jgi:hypothetical protein
LEELHAENINKPTINVSENINKITMNVSSQQKEKFLYTCWLNDTTNGEF